MTGLAKKEMQKVIKKQQARISDLKSHIEQGNKVLQDKQKVLDSQQPPESKKASDDKKEVSKSADTKSSSK